MDTINNYKDLDIEQKNEMYECRRVSISEILNTEIVIIDYQTTQIKKDNREAFVVHFAFYEKGKKIEEMKDQKFFTSSQYIKERLKKTKEYMPFITTIKQVNGKYYSFN